MWLGLACFANAQSQSCPSITINDLGSATEFSSNGLVSRGIVPVGESVPSIPVRIRNFTIVCDASGNLINTSSFVSVVVEFQCDFMSPDSSLAVCSNPNNIVTRQYQFECIERDEQPVWDASVSGSNSNVQTISPTATLSTPLANQCRRCIDDQQSTRADPTTHCDPCPSRCDQGQRRCYLGPTVDICCIIYLEGNCRAEDCPSALVADSNFNCVCPALTLVNGIVRYSGNSNVVRDVGSVATHTCTTGFRLIPQGMGDTRTCNTSGWSDPVFMCEQIVCPDLTIMNGIVRISPPGRPLNSWTEYICNDGYALKGDGNRICQADSTWNGTDPECTDCSQALLDPNCEECGYNSNNVPICTNCKTGYRAVDGQCALPNEDFVCPSSDPQCGINNNITVITSVVSVVIIAIAVATLIIFALVFVRVKRKRAALLQHDYDYAIPQLPKANTTSHEGEPTESNSLYATIGDVEKDVCIRMDENLAYQPSTNFPFARNPAYGTNVGIAPEIETEENAAYHCDIAIL